MARAGQGVITKFALPGLIPFFITVTLYFVKIGQTERRTVISTVYKCLPIISLWAFVLLTLAKLRSTSTRRYKSLILLGLIFSCLGDLLLNYDLFEAGMGGFAVAQIFYISAFGFQPLRPWIALPLYGIGVAAVALMFGNLPTIIKICLPIYGVLLVTMCWRSLARIDCFKNILRLICGMGSVLFVISDSIIAFDKFFSPISNAQLSIMVTYYVAQFAIALSVVEVEQSTLTPKSQTANLSSPKSKHQNGMKKTSKVA